MNHAWTGLVSLGPGQEEPNHCHTTPEILYVLQVSQSPLNVFITSSLREDQS